MTHVFFPSILIFALLGLAAFFLVRLASLNRTVHRLKAGNLSVPIPRTRIPLLREVADHFVSLGKAMADLQKMEEYQQKTLAYEKRELAHFLEEENQARVMKVKLAEIQEAFQTITNLNTDLESKNRSLNDAINRVSALNQFSRILGLTRDRKQIYQLVVSLPVELLRADIGHLLLMDAGTGDLVLDFSQGLQEEGRTPTRVPAGTGMAGWVAKNKKPLLVSDFSQQDLFSPRSRLGYERRTAVSAPIMIREEVIGVITVINKEGGLPFTEEDKTLLATIASEAAMAIHNMLLLDKVQTSYFGMVKALVTAVEAKDIYTRGHSERVTQYSMLIAEEMSLPGRRLDIIQKAGFLHDIGKITVELSILNKPAALERWEYDMIKFHPEVGYRILEPIDFEEEIKICALQHHERLDGKGYPRGCCERDLILEARILSVADAFDAMTTKRPYREPIGVDDALRELERCAGSQFDPTVVQAFKRKLEKMLSFGRDAAVH